jgi:hypothetical protein
MGVVHLFDIQKNPINLLTLLYRDRAGLLSISCLYAAASRRSFTSAGLSTLFSPSILRRKDLYYQLGLVVELRIDFL